MNDKRTYPDDQEESGEPWLFVREWEDNRLEQEFDYLSNLLSEVTSEIAFRADHPEQRDGTGDIRATDVDLYELMDELTHRRVEWNERHD